MKEFDDSAAFKCSSSSASLILGSRWVPQRKTARKMSWEHILIRFNLVCGFFTYRLTSENQDYDAPSYIVGSVRRGNQVVDS